MCSTMTMKISPNLPPIPCFREEVAGMVLVGSRIPLEYLFDLNKQIAGLPCLYFRIYENGIYVGKSFGKQGPYGRYKAHMDGAQSASKLGRGRLMEIILIWDETKTLSKAELGSLEAAFIQHFPRDVDAITRTNINAMQIVYGEDVRDTHLWSAYSAMQRILTEFAVLHEPVKQVLYWQEIALPAKKGSEPLSANYLTDATGVPDTVVIYVSSEQLSKLVTDRYWSAIKLPKTRRHRVRFIVFYADGGDSVGYIGEIQSKHKLSEGSSSVTYDLKLRKLLLLMPAQYSLLCSLLASPSRRYIRLEKILMGQEIS